MSRYELGRLLFDASNDAASVADEYRADAEAVMARYRLSDDERRMLRDRDIRAIYECGVPPLLVRTGGIRLLGVRSLAAYRAALAGAVAVDD